MDDETPQFEAELKRLRPIAPSRRLIESIDLELAAATTRRRRPKAIKAVMFWSGTLAAAAAIALLVRSGGQHSNRARPGTPAVQAVVASSGEANEAPFKPISAENVLISANDEGLVTLDDGTQARRERLHFVDTITWRNPRTNASLRWSVPREEVRVIPIALQ